MGTNQTTAGERTQQTRHVPKPAVVILDRLITLERDERLQYAPARVDVNAPLALIQVALETEVNALRWVLGMPAFVRRSKGGQS
jgi:hypothetical protein